MDPITAAKQSKKTVTIILVITGILAIASVITGYYFLQINDISPQNSSASQGCACYFVATNDKITSCSDATTKDAFEFQTGTEQSNNTCSALCDLRSASSISTSAGQEQPTVLACRVSDFPTNPGCIDLSLENESEKRFANEVPKGQDLTVKAKFSTPYTADASNTDFYGSFSFVINGEKVDVPAAQAVTSGTGTEKQYIVSTKVSDYSSADAISIQAIGESTSGSQLTSDACNRVYAVTKPQAPTCTELKAEIINEGTTPKVNEITITTASIATPNTLSVKFSLGSSNQALTTKNIANKLTDGKLVLSKSFLYATSNFVDNKSFSVLDKEVDNMKISAEVYVNGTIITSDNCKGEFEIPEVIVDEPKTPTENPEPEVPVEEPAEPTENTTTSNFKVTKAASLSCVERVTPSNTVRYTITITNNDSDSEKVVRIEDKLPLGFDYVASSTIINGSSQSDTGLVETQLVGSTQQITFEKTGGWTVNAGGVLTIKFTAKVGTDALSGSNLNEVVVVPANNPLTASSVRTSASVIVSQSCTAPETGIFDSTVSKIILAVMIIFMGTFFYFSQSGITIAEKLVYSPLGMLIRTLNLKASNPKQYFEEKVVKELEKKKKN